MDITLGLDISTSITGATVIQDNQIKKVASGTPETKVTSQQFIIKQGL